MSKIRGNDCETNKNKCEIYKKLVTKFIFSCRR